MALIRSCNFPENPPTRGVQSKEQTRKAIFLESLRKSNYNLNEFFGVSSGEKDSEKARSKMIQDYLEQFSIIKRGLLSEEEIRSSQSDGDFWKVYQEYQASLLDSGGIDFDDLLVYAHKILLEQSWCGDVYRAKYRHLCVDEAQDLNKAQYEFLKALCGDSIKSVLMVGDPNQMIYGFNGSSHEYLCDKFPAEFSAKKFELKENYRSSKAVVRASNKLKPNSQVESEFALEGVCEFAGALENEEAEAKWVSAKIKSLLSLKNHEEIEGSIALDKMVVIARNRFVFSALEEEFRSQNIPYALKKGERLSEPESTFGKILDFGVRVRLNPKDWVDGRKLCALLKIKEPDSWGGSNILNAFADAVNKEALTFAELQIDLLNVLANLNLETPNIPKLVSDFSEKIKALSIKVDAIGQAELERSLVELNDFRNCWTLFRKKGLGASLSAFRNSLSLGQLIEEQVSDGVLLSTVHTMKGLEKDIVFLVCMCEGVFPDYRATTKKDLEEEKNNAFVAVTRSRRWLYVSCPKQRKMPWGDSKAQQPSRFYLSMNK
jgi:DNA helicase-2/ATP-dependent DNA helicase PcrA